MEPLMSENTTPASDSPPLDEDFVAGLCRLYQAHVYAQDVHAELWDFALEIDALYATGITISDLRWLCTKAYVEHGEETSVCGDRHRSFKLSTGLNFTPTTCFVLTPGGLQFATTTLRAQSVIR